MAKMHYKPNGKMHNMRHIKAISYLGWTLAFALAAIMIVRGH